MNARGGFVRSCARSAATPSMRLGILIGTAGLVASGMLAPAPARGQSAAAGQRDSLLRARGLTSQQIARAMAGDPAVTVLRGGDRDEISLVGVVAIAASYERVRAALSDVESWVRLSPGRVGIGGFGTPASASDAAQLRLDPQDVDALARCRPGACQVKLPAASMSQYQAALGQGGAAASAEVLMREHLARYVNDYRARGRAAILDYADGDVPVSAAQVFDSLLGESPFLLEHFPEFLGHLRDFPNAPVPGDTDVIYWASDRLPPLKPMTILVHAAYQQIPGRQLALLGEKQLYSSHYFDGEFTLTSAEPSSGGRTLLVVVRRLHFDKLPSGGPFDIRGRVTRETRDAMQRELGARAAALAQP